MKKLFTLSLFVLCAFITAFSTNYNSTGSTAWNLTSTWISVPGGVHAVPGSGDNVTILNTHNVEVSRFGSCANLTINSGGTLTYLANVAITVNGSYTLLGTESGTGQLKFSGSGSTLTVTGTVGANVIYNFNATCSIAGSSVISKTTNTVINSGCTVTNNGTYTMGSFTTAASSQWTNVGTLTLTINGFMPNGSGTFDASSASNTVVINYATGDIPKTSAGYYHLTVSGTGTKNLLQNLITAKNLTISSGATLNSNNFNLTIGGNWSKPGTFTASAGHTVTFNGTAGQTISGSGTTTFEQLTVSNTTANPLLAIVSITSGSYILNDVLTMNHGIFNTNGNNFTMISDATKTARIAQVASGCNILGNFIIDRYISTRDTTWADLSSPVQGSTFNDWASELQAISYNYVAGSSWPTQETWSESANDFVPLTSSSTTLTPGKGFEVYLSGDFAMANLPNTTLTTVGVPNYGDQSLTSLISYTHAYPAGSSNLVGNPFASSISWSAVLAASTHLDPTIDMFDYTAGAYTNYSAGTVIGSTQGFWVYTLTNTATFNIPESAKTTATSSSLRTSIPEDFFTLKLSSADNKTPYYQILKVGASQDATDGFDIGKDHWFRKSPMKTTPVLFSTIDRYQSSINVFNSNDENYDMPISTSVGISGYYKLDANNFGILSEYSCITLEDKLLNKTIDLKAQPSYSFRLNTTDNENRFIIHFSKSGNCNVSSGLKNLSTFENHTEILPTLYGNIINFNLNETTNSKVSVVNLLGQTIVEPTNVEALNQSINIYLPEGFSGMYLVKIESEKETTIKKFIK